MNNNEEYYHHYYHCNGDYDHEGCYHGLQDQDYNMSAAAASAASSTTSSPAWNVPSTKVMNRRSEARSWMIEETKRQKQIIGTSNNTNTGCSSGSSSSNSGKVLLDVNSSSHHSHHHSASNKGRNVIHVLYDRSLHGRQHKPKTSRMPTTFNNVKTKPRRRRMVDANNNGSNKSPRTTIATPFPYTTTTTTTTTTTSEQEHRHPHHHTTVLLSSSGVDGEEEEAETRPLSSSRSSLNTFPFPSSNSITEEIQTFAEYYSVTKYQASYLTHLGGNDDLIGTEDQDETNEQQQRQRQRHSRRLPRPPSSAAVSTISIAFSHDGKTMASTHGDHTVKITQCTTGTLLQTLEGHPRTPWTVKYHPINPNIVASGCLGHQVRIWYWPTKVCLQMIRLEFAIISLSFHPSGSVLAIANGTRLHFWAFAGSSNNNNDDDDNVNDTNNSDNNTTNNKAQINNNNQSLLLSSSSSSSSTRQQQQQQPSRGILTEVEQRHMLRCVHFPPNGTTIIVGGVNPQSSSATSAGEQNRRRGGISGGGMSFYLRLWDFDLHAAIRPNDIITGIGSSTRSGGGGGHHHSGLRRRAISNPRTFVPRALLYNDGGFDVSPDGKTLCACAEYWLPDGTNNAVDLLHRHDNESDDDGIFSDSSDDDSSMNDFHHDNEVAEHHSIDFESDVESDGPYNGIDRQSETIISSDQQHSSLRRSNAASRSCSSMDTSGHETVHSHGSSPPRPPLPHSTPVSSWNSSSYHSQPPTQHGPMTPIGGRTPQTPPPNANQSQFPLSPPSPPGRRFAGGLGQQRQGQQNNNSNHSQQQRMPSASTRLSSQPYQQGTSGMPPPPAPPGINNRPINPMATPTNNGQTGRFVPHVVTISLDTTPFLEVQDETATTSATTTTTTTYHSSTGLIGSTVPTATLGIPGRGIHATSIANGGSDANATKPHSRKLRPRLGQLLEACPLDGAKASAVTCVKFSPSTDFCLIGYGVREPVALDSNGNQYHPVTALYKIRGGMSHVSTMLSGDDDVNIARFHPDSGYGFVYGTKQGRVRVMGPRPWNYYNC